MNWHIYKERLWSTEPSKFPPPKLSSLSTCPRNWLDERSDSVTWSAFRCIYSISRWGVWLRGNIPHGSPHLFCEWIKKKEPFVSAEPSPSQGAKLCSNFWTPSSLGCVDSSCKGVECVSGMFIQRLLMVLIAIDQKQVVLSSMQLGYMV